MLAIGLRWLGGNNRITRERCLAQLSSIEDCRGGVYILRGEEGVLYIGRSVNLKDRISSHLIGIESRTHPFKRAIRSVEGFYENDVAYQEIYEAYAIRQFEPIHNKAKTNRIRGNYGSYPSPQ